MRDYNVMRDYKLFNRQIVRAISPVFAQRVSNLL